MKTFLRITRHQDSIFEQSIFTWETNKEKEKEEICCRRSAQSNVEPLKIEILVWGHSLNRSLDRLHRSVVCLSSTARFSLALRCAHLIICLLTHSLDWQWKTFVQFWKCPDYCSWKMEMCGRKVEQWSWKITEKGWKSLELYVAGTNAETRMIICWMKIFDKGFVLVTKVNLFLSLFSRLLRKRKEKNS